jgi:hypothetical protein
MRNQNIERQLGRESINTTNTTDTDNINCHASLSEPNDRFASPLLRGQASPVSLERNNIVVLSPSEERGGNVRAQNSEAEPEIEFVQSHWDEIYSKITKENFYYIKASLFDNGEKKLQTQYKLSVSYVTKRGSTDWKSFTIPFPKRQRDVKYNLPMLEEGVSVWEHDFYRNMVDYKDDLYASKMGSEWVIVPHIGKAHENKKQGKRKQGMGPVVPFVGACVSGCESDNFLNVTLWMGALKLDIQMDVAERIVSGKPIAIGEWMDSDRATGASRIGRLEL